MKVEVQIDSSVTEPKIIVLTDRMTDEIELIIRKLSEEEPEMVAGFRDDMVSILDQRDLYRIYAEAGRVYAETDSGTFVLRQRLYEMEERLRRFSFVRISNSEIINLRKVKNFDLSFSGTICVSLTNKTVTYVSRRYVSRIKEVLGI